MKENLKKYTFVFLGLMIFHMGVSALMSWVVTMPYFSHYHAGFGLWNFAVDSIGYHEDAIQLMDYLKSGDYRAWWTGSQWWNFHVKWIALSYALMKPHPLSFAPINAMIWALCVVLVHRMVCQIYPNRPRMAIVTSLLFGLWPSFLLNTTQLLRDPFFILGMIMMLLGWVGLLAGKRSIGFSILVGFGVLFAYLHRWYILEPLVLLSILAMILVAWRVRRVWKYTILALVFVSGVGILDYLLERGAALQRISTNDALNEMIQMEKDKVPLWNISDGVSTILPDCLEQRLVLLAYARYNFSKFFKDAESNIDTEYQFRDFFDIIRYIPRALMIGFFEPFPNRWFKEGKSAGRISRITAGLEMFVLYLLLPGFLYFVVVSKVPLQIRIWLAVLCVSLILLTSLLVTNIGALMRMRFVYLLPVLIGGLETWLRVKHLKNAV